MLLLHHCLEGVQFSQTLDSLLMEKNPTQVILRLVPANHHCTFDLLHPGWCYQKTHFPIIQLRELYHLLEFPAVFAMTNRGHYTSSKEALLSQ
jgi:hypothetical protein